MRSGFTIEVMKGDRKESWILVGVSSANESFIIDLNSGIKLSHGAEF